MDMSMSMASTMSMAATATASASAAAASSTDSMSGMDMSSSCTISMLWNWNTIGSCFLSESWYISTKAEFGGTITGIFFLCMAIELVRRLGREYDRRLVLQSSIQLVTDPKVDADGGVVTVNTNAVPVPIPWMQQIIRGLFYGSQFTAAFLVMLLGMYFNGFVLFAIFLGHTVGYIVFGRDLVGIDGSSVANDSGCCC